MWISKRRCLGVFGRWVVGLLLTLASLCYSAAAQTTYATPQDSVQAKQEERAANPSNANADPSLPPDTEGPGSAWGRVREGVTYPRLLSSESPKFTEFSKRFRVDDSVNIAILIETDGRVKPLRITRRVGYGVDEKVFEAISRYRFYPATRDGKPVPFATSQGVRVSLGTSAPDSWHSRAMVFDEQDESEWPMLIDGKMPDRVADKDSQTVVLEFMVRADGSVGGVHNVFGPQAAADLLGSFVAGWKFEPGVKDGQPIASSGRVSFAKGEGGQPSSLSTAAPSQSAPPQMNGAASSPQAPSSPPGATPAMDERKAEVKRTLGVQVLNQGDRTKFADAVADLTEAIELKPNYVEAYVDRCRAYALLSMPPRAVEDCSRAIELKPDEANAYYWRGNAIRPDPRAVEDYTKAIQLNPRFANAYQNRGAYYLNHNRIQEAIQDYTEAIRIQPGSSNLYHQRGLAYIRANDLHSALADFDAAIQRSPNFSEAYNSRASARDANGDREGADADRQRYQQLKSSAQPPASNSPLPVTPLPYASSTAVPNSAPPNTTLANGVYRAGNGVSKPVLVHKVEPEYSEAARKARLGGVVVLYIVIDERGHPVNPRVMTSLGSGLDEKAIEAVLKWRFEPGKKDGKPVSVAVTVEVNFRLL